MSLLWLSLSLSLYLSPSPSRSLQRYGGIRPRRTPELCSNPCSLFQTSRHARTVRLRPHPEKRWPQIRFAVAWWRILRCEDGRQWSVGDDPGNLFRAQILFQRRNKRSWCCGLLLFLGVLLLEVLLLLMLTWSPCSLHSSCFLCWQFYLCRGKKLSLRLSLGNPVQALAHCLLTFSDRWNAVCVLFESVSWE